MSTSLTGRTAGALAVTGLAVGTGYRLGARRAARKASATHPALTGTALPRLVANPGARRAANEIALGVTGSGSQVVWNPRQAPHLFAVGICGTGKTVLVRSILTHARTHERDWQVIALDEHSELADLLTGPGVLCEANVRQARGALGQARAILGQRYADMAAQGVQSHLDLSDPADRRSILVVIDGVEQVDLIGGDGQVLADLLTLTRGGRNAGIHVVMTAQSLHDLPQVLLDQTRYRIAMTRTLPEDSMLVLGHHLATHLPQVWGRAVAAVDGQQVVFQAYLT
jgi:DNA segregation ATPase FtsK/SpoIIIE-like protein